MPQEYVVRWTGGRIGAGATVFHFRSIASDSGAQGIANAARTLFDSLKGYFPDEVVFTFDAEVKELADDGTLMAVYSVTPGANVAGGSSGTYANGSGICVRHVTSAIIGGRRIIGRTFLVPIAASVWNTDGDLSASVAGIINSTFATFASAVSLSGSDLSVWSRKNSSVSKVTGSQALARPTHLRSRNDRSN